MEKTEMLDSYLSGDTLIMEEVIDNQLSIQLYCMGFLPGEKITIERIAPFGDPLIISVDDTFISLRRDDAAKIRVKRAES
ncbi:MAG: ferrous iron transport protein A [Flavobacteriales bacterium]|nr:ferrous iron transport protein A [Flavobacteriales bacterium]|tara:strand:- start:2135 stop:2374 length:240 start_codon:yes stop_codon:yes gene_type:complete